MDVNILSKLIKELILEHDKVAFCTLGTFTAELMPASVSEKGTVINPPYRKLHFRQNGHSTDSLLVSAYALLEKITPEQAEERVTAFGKEFSERLNRNKSLVLPGLGTMRANSSNDWFFIADRNLDIYPEGYGLKPVAINVIDIPEPEVEAEAEVEGETVSEAAAETTAVAKPARKRNFFWLWVILIVLFLLAMIALTATIMDVKL